MHKYAFNKKESLFQEDNLVHNSDLKIHLQHQHYSPKWHNMAMRSRLKLFCKNTVSLILPVNSKGALLVLLWSTMMFIYQFFVIGYIASDNLSHTIFSHTTIATRTLIHAVLPTYLVIGLVADVCVGRYKIIVASIYCAFIGWITLCVSFYVTYKFANFTLVAVGFLLSTVGAAGIQSIAIPFNIDQMIGATADELSNIIYWHGFGLPFALTFVQTSSCFITDEVYQQSIAIWVSGVAITIVMVTYYLMRHHLDTTPLLTNPVKLIVKVLNYARKNKYPRHRSALTYWEESAPSRLDLGKDKYGGPFTEEEVEDVKTFFRYLPLLVCLFGYTAVIILIPSFNIFSNTGKVMYSCLLQNGSLGNLTISISLITYNVVFSKCYYKYVPSMLKRIGLGLCLLLLSMIVLVAMDLQHYNIASNCTLSSITYNSTNTNLIFTSLFQVICGIGIVTVVLVSLELTVAQSPVHMRGLMVGVWFGAIGVFAGLSYSIYVPHTLIRSHCTLYYHVTVSVCLVVTILVYGVLAKCYKLRTRNEPINIPHIVATVYERYIEQSQQHRQLHGGNEALVYERIESIED